MEVRSSEDTDFIMYSDYHSLFYQENGSITYIQSLRC